MLQRLQNLDVEKYTPAEMVEMLLAARALKAGFAEYSMEAPAFIDSAIATLDSTLKVRRKASIEKRLSEIRSQESGLRTAEERRKDLASEREKLEAQLATV